MILNTRERFCGPPKDVRGPPVGWSAAHRLRNTRLEEPTYLLTKCPEQQLFHLHMATGCKYVFGPKLDNL